MAIQVKDFAEAKSKATEMGGIWVLFTVGNGLDILNAPSRKQAMLWSNSHDFVACFFEGRVMIERRTEQPAPVEEEATPELTETETIALMLIADTPMGGLTVWDMSDDGIMFTDKLYGLGFVYPMSSGNWHASDSGRAYLAAKGL